MAAQKANSAIVFVAVLIAAVIVIFAIVNRPGKVSETDQTTQPPASPEPEPVAETPTDPGVTHIDQTTDTTNPPATDADENAGEAGDGAAAGDAGAEDTAGDAPVVPNLIDAAERGDMAALASMIESGADLNQTDSAGRTALMAAAGGGHVEAVFALLNAGADPDLRDNTRRSARDYALARYDEPGQTIARILGELSTTPPADPTDK